MGTGLARLAGMTITDLKTLSCFRGWTMVADQPEPPALSPRERQVLDAVLSGSTHKEVAFDLGVAAATVRVLYARAMKKLGRARAARRSEAVWPAEPAADAPVSC